jgi:hypothetical protein
MAEIPVGRLGPLATGSHGPPHMEADMGRIYFIGPVALVTGAAIVASDRDGRPVVGL